MLGHECEKEDPMSFRQVTPSVVLNPKTRLRIWTVPFLVTLFLVVGAGSPAIADVIRNSTCLPPVNSEYLAQIEQWVISGTTYALSGGIHSQFTNCTVPPGTDHFNSSISGALSINGVSQGNVSGNATVSVVVSGGPSTFTTQMTQLDLSGLGGNSNIHLRIDPVNPSTGVTTETPLGGGLFQISSFFDVFVDLSIDGGVTWTPPTNSSHVTLVESIPEPATVLLIGFGLAALGSARRLRKV
jgi:hypothetical protein